MRRDASGVTSRTSAFQHGAGGLSAFCIRLKPLAHSRMVESQEFNARAHRFNDRNLVSRPSVMLVSVAQDVRSREGLVDRREADVACGCAGHREALRRLQVRAEAALGTLDPFEILPYRGYGTSRELFLRGRVLEETGITRAGRDDAVWRTYSTWRGASRAMKWPAHG